MIWLKTHHKRIVGVLMFERVNKKLCDIVDGNSCSTFLDILVSMETCK